MRFLVLPVLLLLGACGESLPPVPADTPERAAARARLVEEEASRLRVDDPAVLDALRAVPRHSFLPAGMADRADEAGAIRRPDGETLSAVGLAGAMLQTLCLKPGSRVLECGTRSGWLTALLAHLAGEVVTVDARPGASAGARRVLGALGIGNVTYRIGDPLAGRPEDGTFDAIVVNGAVPHIPRELYAALAPGGRILAPVGDPGEPQTLILVTRGERGPSETRPILTVRFGALQKP